MAVAGRDLQSCLFPIRSQRAGGATSLYHAGLHLEYIRRFGRWESPTFAIYLDFGDKIIRSLSTCLMRSEGLAT